MKKYLSIQAKEDETSRIFGEPLIEIISPIAGQIIRESEMNEGVSKKLFSLSLFDKLHEKNYTNPFHTRSSTVGDFMGEYFQNLSMANYSMKLYLDFVKKPLYAASAERLDPKEFHDCIDGKTPVGLAIFLKQKLVIGTTYCCPLNRDIPIIQDLSCGFFSLYNDKLTTMILLDHKLHYFDRGFWIGEDPILKLDMQELEKSECQITVGMDDSTQIEDIFPNWTNNIEGIVATKLV